MRALPFRTFQGYQLIIDKADFGEKLVLPYDDEKWFVDEKDFEIAMSFFLANWQHWNFHFAIHIKKFLIY